jgi:hypothetical protein
MCRIRIVAIWALFFTQGEYSAVRMKKRMMNEENDE